MKCGLGLLTELSCVFTVLEKLVAAYLYCMRLSCVCACTCILYTHDHMHADVQPRDFGVVGHDVLPQLLDLLVSLHCRAVLCALPI